MQIDCTQYTPLVLIEIIGFSISHHFIYHHHHRQQNSESSNRCHSVLFFNFFFRCSCGVIQHCSFVYFTHMCVWFSFGLWAKSIHFAVCSLDALFASPAFNCTLDVVIVINLRFCSLYCNF